MPFVNKPVKSKIYWTLLLNLLNRTFHLEGYELGSWEAVGLQKISDKLLTEPTASPLLVASYYRYLPAIGRFLIVVTFLEDALRIMTQWSDQLLYLHDYRRSMPSPPPSAGAKQGLLLPRTCGSHRELG